MLDCVDLGLIELMFKFYILVSDCWFRFASWRSFWFSSLLYSMQKNWMYWK